MRVSREKSLSKIFLILFLGSVVGSLLGRLLAWMLPNGSVVERFFLISAHWGFEPTTLNAGLFSFTLGMTFELNVAGIIGIAAAVYVLRYYL